MKDIKKKIKRNKNKIFSLWVEKKKAMINLNRHYSFIPEML